MIAGLPLSSWILLAAAVGLGGGIQLAAWLVHRSTPSAPADRKESAS